MTKFNADVYAERIIMSAMQNGSERCNTILRQGFKKLFLLPGSNFKQYVNSNIIYPLTKLIFIIKVRNGIAEPRSGNKHQKQTYILI